MMLNIFSCSYWSLEYFLCRNDPVYFASKSHFCILRAFVIAKHNPTTCVHIPQCILDRPLAPAMSFSVDNPNNTWLCLQNSSQRSCSRGGGCIKPPNYKGRVMWVAWGMQPPESWEVDVIHVLEDEIYWLGNVLCVLEQRGGSLWWKIAFCKRECRGEGPGN